MIAVLGLVLMVAAGLLILCSALGGYDVDEDIKVAGWLAFSGLILLAVGS